MELNLALAVELYSFAAGLVELPRFDPGQNRQMGTLGILILKT